MTVNSNRRSLRVGVRDGSGVLVGTSVVAGWKVIVAVGTRVGDGAGVEVSDGNTIRVGSGSFWLLVWDKDKKKATAHAVRPSAATRNRSRRIRDAPVS
jgi:hypothetical protein